MAVKKPDRRIARTRAALVKAFVALFFERPYDRVTVADIVAHAGVGRSTFYEHYTDKEEILADSIRAPFTLLASSVDRGSDVAAVTRVLDHFWQHQQQARSLFGSSARRPIARVLASLIGERLRVRRGATTDDAPVRLAAVALAESQIGSIATWLRGELACSGAELAEVLHRLAQASAKAIGNASGNASG